MAAEVRRKIEQRIDDQLAAAVVRANLETDAVRSAQNKASGYRHMPVSVALVHVRRFQAQAAIVLAGEDQIAAVEFQLQFARTIKFQLRLGRVGAGSNP